MNVDTRDLFRDGSDLPASKPYHVEDLIQHHYVSDKVVVVQAPQLPSKTKLVSLSDAYYHLYKWHFCALTIDYHQEVGVDLHQIVYRMLKYRCHRDPELLSVIENEVPSAFYKIQGGGKILTRVQGSTGLRSQASLKEIWTVMHWLIRLSNNPDKTGLYISLEE